MRGVEQIPWLYDAWCGVAERFGLQRWRRWLVGGARGRILEVGCGTGRNLPLYPPGARVVAIEPWAPALARARRRAPAAALVQASAEALPFRAAVFDTVVSGLVFCSVADVDAGLAEVRRVLGPHGGLRMLEHVRSARPWKARLQDRFERAWMRFTGGCRWNRDTEGAVRRAGFAIDPATLRARGEMRRFAAKAWPPPVQ
ncbi:MAG TPA: class I SAM-dependent methyltransferase [Candidatus Limnocylindria bacterium]|nr:class I SAM-dependent methyltransferase [Candidatus Limnocylindria bacterium]